MIIKTPEKLYIALTLVAVLTVGCNKEEKSCDVKVVEINELYDYKNATFDEVVDTVEEKRVVLHTNDLEEEAEETQNELNGRLSKNSPPSKGSGCGGKIDRWYRCGEYVEDAAKNLVHRKILKVSNCS